MGLKANACTEDVINALLGELRRDPSPAAQRIYATISAHVERLREPWDPTWTIQALDGVIRQMNSGGFKHVVARVVGGSRCTSAQMASVRLEPLTPG